MEDAMSEFINALGKADPESVKEVLVKLREKMIVMKKVTEAMSGMSYSDQAHLFMSGLGAIADMTSNPRRMLLEISKAFLEKSKEYKDEGEQENTAA